jgi:hypothetical protein
MYTVIAFAAVGTLAFWSDRSSTKEQKRPFNFDDALVRQSVVFARQDSRLIVYLLAAILLMLGVIADRLH